MWFTTHCFFLLQSMSDNLVNHSNQVLSLIYKHTKHTTGWTHRWTVHSGIDSGICPFFSRLQSTSSPEHTQGGGQVVVVAPDPNSIPQKSNRTTGKPAKLQSCVEERIFLWTQKRSPRCSYTKKSKDRNHQKVGGEGSQTLCCFIVIDP